MRLGLLPESEWSAFVAGFESGYLAGLAQGYAEGIATRTAQLRDVGAAVVASALWAPGAPSAAERRARWRAMLARGDSRPGPELVRAARQSWGLEPAAEGVAG